MIATIEDLDLDNKNLRIFVKVWNKTEQAQQYGSNGNGGNGNGGNGSCGLNNYRAPVNLNGWPRAGYGIGPEI